VIAGLLGVLVLAGVPEVGTAQDDSSAFRDLATGSDFRVRVAAALALGKSRSPGARPALEKALGDAHPSVRAAAAAGLGALGDARAAPALKRALDKETTVTVRAQIESTITRLAGSGPAQKARFLVSVGKLENKSGVSGPVLASALKSSTRARMAQVPGVEVVAEGADVAVEGKSRNLPAFTVDGSLTQLSKKQSSDGVSFSARVEYLIKRMPDQALKGTMSGVAQAAADAKEIRGQSELSQLQLDAVAAAIDSALKGASPALEAAMK
jgi:hypothetical protein